MDAATCETAPWQDINNNELLIRASRSKKLRFSYKVIFSFILFLKNLFKIIGVFIPVETIILYFDFADNEFRKFSNSFKVGSIF